MSRGVTLIETVLYLTLFSIIMALILPVLIELDRFQVRQQFIADAVNTHLYFDDRIRGLFRLASEIVEPVLGEGGERLVVRDSLGQNIYFEPQNIFATSTKVVNQNFLRSEAFGFEKVEFGVVINGVDFGTTTYVFYK
jgi:type II secretory pathway pseudopilin PulG